MTKLQLGHAPVFKALLRYVSHWKTLHIRGPMKLELRRQVRTQSPGRTGGWSLGARNGEKFVVAECDDQQAGGPRYPDPPPSRDG